MLNGKLAERYGERKRCFTLTLIRVFVRDRPFHSSLMLVNTVGTYQRKLLSGATLYSRLLALPTNI